MNMIQLGGGDKGMRGDVNRSRSRMKRDSKIATKMAVRQTLYFSYRCGCPRTSSDSIIINQHFKIKRNYSTSFSGKPRDESNLDASTVKERLDDLAASHIPTTSFQKFLLTVGSASISILNPTRPEMIAVLGEATGKDALKYIHKKMESDKEGREILSKQPRINSRTVDLEALNKMPEGSLGKVYTDFLHVQKITPDSRQTVQFVDDMELAYVMQRYREVHDLIHTVLNMPTNMLGEVAVKWVEGIQTRLPMCLGGALFGPLRLGPKQRQKYVKYYLPWAIQTGFEANFLMNVFFEKRWDQPVSELLEELNIKPLKLE